MDGKVGGGWLQWLHVWSPHSQLLDVEWRSAAVVVVVVVA